MCYIIGAGEFGDGTFRPAEEAGFRCGRERCFWSEKRFDIFMAKEYAFEDKKQWREGYRQ